MPTTFQQFLDQPLTHADLAASCGFAPSTVAHWRHGTKRPSVEACHALNGKLGIVLSSIRPDIWPEG